MRHLPAVIILVILLFPTGSVIQAQQSTTGPQPPPGTDRGWTEPSRAQVVISGVPTYIWHHGCGPTAVGMVIGYWDGQGADDLVAGDASTQTSAADAMMADDEGNSSCGAAESNHFQDYSCPKDNYPNMLADMSELGTPHSDNCVADFMYTSQSASLNYYGWSWFSHVSRSFTEYVELVSPGRNPQTFNRFFTSDRWNDYKEEIDNGRPVVLLVDSDGDGSTDHFVTGVGYDESTMKYAIHDTWDHSIHWYAWRVIANGSAWGVYGYVTFSLQIEPQIEAVSPAQNQIDVSTDSDISVTFNIGMDDATIDASTFFVRGSLTGLHSGTISYDSPSRTATFDPTVGFAAGEVVSVAITTGVKSSLGDSLSPGKCWTFITATDGGGLIIFNGYYTTADAPRAVQAADFSGDGHIDLVTAGGGGVSVFIGQGDGTFAPRADYSVGQWPYAVTGADLDNDGDIDLVAGCETSEYMGYCAMLINRGDGTFESPIIYPVGNGPRSIIAADFDGDGYADVAIGSYWPASVSVLMNNGDGTFGADTEYTDGSTPYAVCAPDCDNDFDLDLGVATISPGDIRTLANNGYGTFGDAVVHGYAWCGRSITCADFNNDGYADLANAAEDGEYMGYLHIFLNNGDGSYDLDHGFYVGGTAVSVVAGDLDGDGDIDLATGSDVAEYVHCVWNGGDGTFVNDLDAFPGSDHRHVLCAGDFNGDGTLDLAKADRNGDNLLIYLNYAYICGDANGDRSVNIGDAVYVINWVFRGGDPPDPMEAGDTNCDGPVNVGDAVFLINYIFKYGPAPCADCP